MVRGEWRKLHREELNDLYITLNTFRIIKSRRLNWAGYVALMEVGVKCIHFVGGEN